MSNSELADRPVKKAKPASDATATAKAGPSTPAPPSSSRIFAPFRALGYVCNHVPFAMFVHVPKGALATPAVQVVVSVGRSWMMWDAGRMTLLFVGKSADVRGKQLVEGMS